MNRVKTLTAKLGQFPGPLPGLKGTSHLQTFVRRLEESERRSRFFSCISQRPGADPSKVAASGFDPLKSAVWYRNSGDLDEACWLVFLSVHFGKHRTQKWALVREVYNGQGSRWTWKRTSADTSGFRAWFSKNHELVRVGSGGGLFGNHRKYESLRPDAKRNLPDVVQSYVNWVVPSHQSHFKTLRDEGRALGQSPFQSSYNSMKQVLSFGRTGRFDYLSTLSGLGIVNVCPTSPCLVGASGPLAGARLLFGKGSTKALEAKVLSLGSVLGVGMDVLEDALCNWQKNPKRFTPFRG